MTSAKWHVEDVVNTLCVYSDKIYPVPSETGPSAMPGSEVSEGSRNVTLAQSSRCSAFLEAEHNIVKERLLIS